MSRARDLVSVVRSDAMPTNVRSLSLEERRRLVAESLHVGNPGNRARDLPEQADPRHECPIELNVDDIRPYEHNPRRADNSRFAEIKESIRAIGVRNPLTVTRRPSEKHFIVEAGGNTRLLAVQQLWGETHDPRFQRLTVLFRPWQSEAQVLTAHLIENEQRGEMSFWDKATGVLSLKARLEEAKGLVLSLRSLEEEMKALGLSVNTATLGLYFFAIERLRTLGDAGVDISGLDVKVVQPRLNLLKRHALSRGALSEQDLYATVFEPVFHEIVDQYQQSQTFSATGLIEVCEQALASRLGEPVAQLRIALNAAARSPNGPTRAEAENTSGGLPSLPLTSPPATVGSCPAGTSDRTGGVEAFSSGIDNGAGSTSDAMGRMDIAVSRLVDRVRLVATLAGIDSLVRLDPAAPLGYRMDPLLPVSEPFPSPTFRQQLWTMLAAFAGQLGASETAFLLVGVPPAESGTGDASQRGGA